MYDLAKSIQATLLTSNLPTYNENFITTSIAIPCVSWNIENYDNNMVGDTMVYDNAEVVVKVWTTSLSTNQTNCDAVNDILLENGYRRIGYNQYKADNNVCVGVMRYSCTIKEDL